MRAGDAVVVARGPDQGRRGVVVRVRMLRLQPLYTVRLVSGAVRNLRAREVAEYEGAWVPAMPAEAAA
jgi:ribosomal protein L24